MKQFLAYFLLIFLPILTGYVSIFVLFFTSIICLFGVKRIIVSYISILIGAGLTLYLYYLFFNYLSVDFGLLAVLIAAVSTVIMLFYRLNIGRNAQYEKTVTTLEIIGITLTGIYLIYF